MQHFILYSVLLLILLGPYVAAQVLPFKSYTIREGLLSNGITTLFQDSYGYLWIGTTDGLSVYDGQSFKNYTVVDGLASSWVNCITEDRLHRGVIWIATLGGGVSRFVDGKFTNYTIGVSDFSNRVNTIAEDSSGTLYCGTDQGLYILKGGRSVLLSKKLAGKTIAQVIVLSDSLVILENNGELLGYSLKDRSIGRITGIRPISNQVSAVAMDSSGDLWAALNSGMVVDVSHPSGEANVGIQSPNFLLVNDHGSIWEGGANGVCEFDKKTLGKELLRHVTVADGLPDDEVWSGLVDSEGDLWFAVGAIGLCKLPDQSTFGFGLKVPSVVLDNAQAASDKFGHVWFIGPKGMLEVWRGAAGNIRSFLHPYQEFGINDPEYCLRITDGSALWLCTEEGNVNKYEIRSGDHRHSHVRLLNSYRIWGKSSGGSFLTFYVDHSQRIWCSLSQFGLLELDTKSDSGSRRVRTIQAVLPDSSVRSIFEDKEGNMWFGGYIGGLVEMRDPFLPDQSVRKYTTANGLPDNSIRAIAQDAEGRIWIGTRFMGIAVLDRKKFTRISAEDGLISNGVWAVDPLPDGEILVGTQLGVDRLSQSGSGRWRFTSVGARTPVYSVGISSSNLEWMCTLQSETVTDLSHRNISTGRPAIRLTGFYVNGRAVHAVSHIRFRHDMNTVTFRFDGISLRHAKDLKYRFELSGVDKSWRSAPGIRAVTYVSLKPGAYTFRAYAVTPHGLTSVDTATASFTILSPVWQVWWFIVLVSALTVGIVYSLIRAKVNRIVEISLVRSRIAADLHDEIGSGLTKIAMLADFLSNGDEQGETAVSNPGHVDGSVLRTRSMASRIGSGARDLIESMRDVVWSIDPAYDSLQDFLFYFRAYANGLTDAKRISFIMSSSGTDRVRISPQVKRVLQLVSKEALTNAVKYSGCTTIKYGLTVIGRRVRILVEDDGCGFDPVKIERGRGLNNIEKHAREKGGELVLDTTLGRGTRLVFSFTLSR